MKEIFPGPFAANIKLGLVKSHPTQCVIASTFYTI